MADLDIGGFVADALKNKVNPADPAALKAHAQKLAGQGVKIAADVFKAVDGLGAKEADPLGALSKSLNTDVAAAATKAIDALPEGVRKGISEFAEGLQFGIKSSGGFMDMMSNAFSSLKEAWKPNSATGKVLQGIVVGSGLGSVVLAAGVLGGNGNKPAEAKAESNPAVAAQNFASQVRGKVKGGLDATVPIPQDGAGQLFQELGKAVDSAKGLVAEGASALDGYVEKGREALNRNPMDGFELRKDEGAKLSLGDDKGNAVNPLEDQAWINAKIESDRVIARASASSKAVVAGDKGTLTGSYNSSIRDTSTYQRAREQLIKNGYQTNGLDEILGERYAKMDPRTSPSHAGEPKVAINKPDNLQVASSGITHSFTPGAP